MKKEAYLQVKCPGPPSGEGCGRYLTKFEFTHHGLVKNTCPECGFEWRLYHDAYSPTVELTFCGQFSKDDRNNDEPAMLSVSYGRHEAVAPESVEVKP